MKPDFQPQDELRREVYSCHVSPLPVHMKEHQLRSLFKDYNDVCGAYVFHQNLKENMKYTYGFIRFKSKKSADHAVQYFANKVNGWPLAVRHSKESLKQMAAKTNKSHSEPPSFVLDKDYVKVFKQFWQTDCTEESFDSTLKNINKKRVGSFHLQSPISALSVDLTETTTQNTDYKLWHTFFREQNYISKSLMEIIRNQESLDISNPGKCDPRQSKSIIKEKDPGKDVCGSINEICPLATKAHLEINSIGRGNLCVLDNESKSDSQSRRHSSSSKEFIHSESEEEGEDKTYYTSEDQRAEYSSDDEEDNSYHINEDERLGSFQYEELRTNGSLLTENLCSKRNTFSPRCYPIGRGMGLALAYQQINNLNQDGSSTGFSKINSQFKNRHLKDSISNTYSEKENIDESLGSWDVFLDP